MPSVCLISPGHLRGNPRLVKEADALAFAGYEVLVITGLSFAPYADEPRFYASRPWTIVARVPFGAMASLSSRWVQRFRQRLSSLICRLGLRPQWLVLRAWHPAGPDLIRAAKAVEADLYIAHYPAALAAAALAARQWGSAYAFDAEDFHLGDLPDSRRYDFQRSLLRTIESCWLPGCAFMTAASLGIAKAYATSYGLPAPTVVRNVFPLNQAPPGPTPAGTVRPGPTLYWFSQTIGSDRGLECAIRALAQARCLPHLHLRGFISSSYREELLTLARQFGVEQRLHLHPPAHPEQLERLASAFDVGLVAETGYTSNRRIALTNKLFTYALAGIPMLLSDIPAHRAVLAEAGGAAQIFNHEDPASLAAAIDRWLAAPPAVLARAREAAYRIGQDSWNWDREQSVLLERVASVLPLQPANGDSAHE